MPQRFATLLVVLAAASPAWAQAPVTVQRDPAAEQAPTTIDAERIEGVGEYEFGATGRAQIQQDELTIFGESLRYNPELGRVEGEGGVRLQIGPDRFFGPRLRYDTLGDTGYFEEPRFLIQGDLTARGGGEQLQFLGPDRYRIKDATFTTCPVGKEDWRLEADELDLDYAQAVGTADNPRLKFFDTTILAAPFATFPLERRRKSGLLAPHFGNSSQRGFELGVPYYWNIAPEYDATITPVYMTERGVMLKNQFRYLNRRFLGESRLEYLPNDESAAEQARYGFSLQHTQFFTGNLTGYVDYNRVSDDRYFVELASEVRQSSVGNLPQDASLVYSGEVGATTYSAVARVQTFQTLQDPLAPIVAPYHRTPQLNFAIIRNDFAGLLDAALPFEYVNFEHESLLEGSRFRAAPTFAAPVLAPGWFFTPKLGLHYASYRVSDGGRGSRTPEASVPWMSADAGLVFERDARWFGEDLVQTLEPRFFYVYAPYREQDRIPIFDTALAEFNFPQLFTENRFTGGDRFGDANQLTAALTSRFLNAAGQEAFRATVGQRYYFADERVTLDAATPVRVRDSSDTLASIGGRLFRHVSFDATTQFNWAEKRAERYSVGARYAPGPAKVINASYRFDREMLRQIDVSGQWPLAAGWFGVARYNYSLLDRRLVDGLAGVEYNAGCWIFRAVYQRIQAAAQVASTALFFQLEFNGIGQVGTTEVIRLLERNVSGYTVSNPTDPALVPEAARPALPFEMVY